MRFTNHQWQVIKSYNQKCSGNKSICDDRYKFLLNHWYFTPERTDRMYPEKDDRCWHCKDNGVDFYHICWGCKWIVNFWTMVCRTIYEILSIKLQFQLRLFLFLDFAYFKIHMHTSLVTYVLTAASLLVPRHWRSEIFAGAKIRYFYEEVVCFDQI